MEDFITMAVLSALCFALYKFGNWCGSKVPYDPVHDWRGYRRAPLTKEDIEMLGRLFVGKSKRECARILRNFGGSAAAEYYKKQMEETQNAHDKES